MSRARAAAALLGLLAAGCTDDASTTGEHGEALRRIRVLARSHLSMAPLLIAEAEGYFHDEGLEVEQFSLASSRDGLPALIQGDLEVLTGSLTPAFLNAIAMGARIRVVADKGHFARDGCTYMAFLARPEMVRDGVLLAPEGGRRWRFSVQRGSFYEMLAERALASAGRTWDDVEVYHLSGEAEAQALAQRRVDVTSTAGVPMQGQIDAGQAVAWRAAQELLPDGQFSVLLFGPALLEQDPEAGIRFMTAYLRAVRQYNSGKTERNLEILAARTGLDRRALEATCWIPMRDDGRIDAPSVAALQGWSTGRGLLDRELALDELWEPRFVAAASRRLEEREQAEMTGNGGEQP